MAINDYLQGINNATAGQKTDVSNAAKDLANLQAGAGSLPAKLKEALNTKLNNNRDIINQQADTMQNYFNSGAAARAKYADVFDPFKKAELVQQERSMALRPYDVLSGVLENRMGSVNDIVQSGISGWQGMVNAAQTKAELAKTNLANALQAYLQASDMQTTEDQMRLEAAKAAEASRQFGITTGLKEKEMAQQNTQFYDELANRLRIANISASGNGGTPTAESVDGVAELLFNQSVTRDEKGNIVIGQLDPAALASLTSDKTVGLVARKYNALIDQAKKEQEQVSSKNAELRKAQIQNGLFNKAKSYLTDYFNNPNNPSAFWGNYLNK